LALVLALPDVAFVWHVLAFDTEFDDSFPGLFLAIFSHSHDLLMEMIKHLLSLPCEHCVSLPIRPLPIQRLMGLIESWNV
jgi:hypothetical protein